MLAATGLAEESPKIEDLEVERRDGRLEVTYVLDGALGDDVLERLQAGIPVTYRHRLQWLARRGLLLPDRELSEVVIVVEATYDSLTRSYQLARSGVTQVRGGKKGPAGPDESRITDSVETLRRWMTHLDAVRLPAPAKLPEGSEQYVRVTTTFGRKFVLGMFPARRSASAEQTLER